MRAASRVTASQSYHFKFRSDCVIRAAMASVLVAKERAEGETRVAATPETVKGMIKAGLTVVVESGAGANAYIADKLYEDAGAQIATDAKQAWAAADVVLKVRAPEKIPTFDEVRSEERRVGKECRSR